MKSHLKNSLIALCLCAATSICQADRLVETRQLDEKTIEIIPVSRKRVTTISFPGPIQGIDGAFVTIDGKTPGMFHLAHAQGTAFFSTRALLHDAETNLNVRWNNKTYVLLLRESQIPVLSLQLQPEKNERNGKSSLTTPATLLGLLDKAKAFPFLAEHHPEAVEGVQFRAYSTDPPTFDYGDFRIELSEAYRFDAQDTLIFQIALFNKTEQEVRYAPDGFAVRVGTRLFSQSMSDATGILPPNAEEIAWFAVTGSPGGGRNELSLKNDFTIIPQRIDHPAEPAQEVAEK